MASRRRDRALALARRYGGASASFDDLPQALLRADIVLAATASPHLLLEARELAEVMAGRGGRPLLLIDLAVPRDIDAGCGELDGVSLYDIDDLEAVVARNRKVRQAEARKAEGIVEEEIGHFATWLGSLEVRPTLAALRVHATEIAEQVLRENEGKWESASPRDLERVDALARAIVNRLLHAPTARMKEMSDDRVHARMALVRDLFGLSAQDQAPGAQEQAPGAEVQEPVAQVHVLPCRPRPPALMRVGTRGSALALAQARLGGRAARSRRRARHVTTSGDRGAPAGDKARWVSALEHALLDGEIDLAVHSAKDVPTELPEGLELVAFPARDDPRDAICGAASLAALPTGARVGTSSLRRAAQLRAAREDLAVVTCAATSTPGCASSPTGRPTRSCSPAPDCSGLGRGDRGGRVPR